MVQLVELKRQWNVVREDFSNDVEFLYQSQSQIMSRIHYRDRLYWRPFKSCENSKADEKFYRIPGASTIHMSHERD